MMEGIEIVEGDKHQMMLRQAYNLGFLHSTDQSTKLGAIICKGDLVLTAGVNGLHPSVENIPERHTRPLKYSFARHAERDAIFVAAKQGISLEGAVMYCPWYSCADCAIAIVSAGIEAVMGHEAMLKKTPKHWKDSVSQGHTILRESGVRLIAYRGRIGDVAALIDYQSWLP